MMSKPSRFSKRPLHTIVSRDIIKPSSPTPSHLKTYNLSLLDLISINAYMPMVAFYPSSNVYQSSLVKTLELKNSLSHTLTQYYPFAGKIKKKFPTFVDCNDEGVEFIEACIDTSLSEFLQGSENEDLNQLYPNDLIWFHPNRKCDDDEGTSSTCPLAVQVNHFLCGGVAVAISLSHKVGDASSIINFMNYWAKVNARSRQADLSEAPPVNPLFITYPTTSVDFQIDLLDIFGTDFVTRSFLFSNQKLNELKAKVIDMTTESGKPIMNPTRVEVLTWLLHKCAVAAATKTNPESFKDTGIIHAVDIRNSLILKFPETSVGNLLTPIEFPTSNQSKEITPNLTIGELRKGKAVMQTITSLDAAVGMLTEMLTDDISTRIGQYYVYSSMCGFPVYSINFGWGKPVKASTAGRGKNTVILMDTPDSSGVEALVCLDRHDMVIFQKDADLLNFCKFPRLFSAL